MAKIIASTYEIIKRIGSGGGGNVYLANHLRLSKPVVLKADKRKRTTRQEMMRREVDVLKDLRHSYIPKVYDYFVEDGITYTVMDFIEGESLDRPLKRGEHFLQPQVIRWAKQLLEALDYLHSPIHGDPPRGYVHSDIKPANLMCTPQNDICLIDFNIALALGEENVVGRSEGYASPEHYGLDYSLPRGDQTAREAETDTISGLEETQILTETIGDVSQTVTLSAVGSQMVYRKIVPDVRSDIYSVGATLYHLLSGRRPAKYADKVTPISEKEFSPQLVRIIMKAMDPNPDLRYQTAAEMLEALSALRENDPRTKQWKRRTRITGMMLGLLFVAGVCTAFIGLKRMQAVERGLKLAGDSQAALLEGDVDAAIKAAFDAIAGKINIITPESPAEAKKALANALGVYDLSDGFRKQEIAELEENPLYLRIAPDSMTAACICGKWAVVIDMQTAEVLRTLPAADSALAEIEYLDEDTIIYAGEEGIEAYSISADKSLWKGTPATAVSVSGDGETVATVYKEEGKALIYDARTGERIGEAGFGGRKQTVSMVSDNFANPYNNLFELSSDGRWLAVSFADGSLSIFDLQNEKEQIDVLDSNSGYEYFAGGFSGEYLAFSTSNGENSIFAIIDPVQGKQTVGLQSESSFSAAADENGVYVQVGNRLVKMDPVTGEQFPLVTVDESIEQFSVGDRYTSISAGDSILIFDSEARLVTEFGDVGETGLLQAEGDIVLSARIDTPEVCIMRYEDNSRAEIAGYDPSFEHDEARISADGKTLMLFSYKHFRVCGLTGDVIAEVEIPDAEEVYDQQFIRDGEISYLEVIYNDGRILTYDAGTGELLSESTGETPDMTLNEVFYTEDYKIEAPLHGTPQVYNRETGEKTGELKEDAYLIYVTQTDDHIIAQYVTAEGLCYGELLDASCRQIADLPYLSDVKDNELYFDYPDAGSLRRTEIYDLDSLIELAEEHLAGSA